ncbi:MAG: hypothetical protein ACLFU8_10985 [Anaerolineales bacterium]
MSKRGFWSLLLVGLLALAFPLLIAAQSELPPDRGTERGFGPGMHGRYGMHGGYGMHRGGYGMGGGWRGGGMNPIAALVEASGMSWEEVITALEAGQSYAAVAEEAGVSLEELVESILAARELALEEAVEAGYISQEQADSMLEEMEEHLLERLSGTWEPRNGGGPGTLRGGRWGRGRGRGRFAPEERPEYRYNSGHCPWNES